MTFVDDGAGHPKGHPTRFSAMPRHRVDTTAPRSSPDLPVQRLENFQKAKLTETDENNQNNLEMLESLLKIETSHPMASLMLGVFLGDTDPNHGRQMMI